MATVRWIAGGNGDWSHGADWDTGTAPTATADVLLDTARTLKVTHSGGADVVHGVQAVTDTVAVTGGSLAVEASSSFQVGASVLGGTLSLKAGGSVAAGPFTLARAGLLHVSKWASLTLTGGGFIAGTLAGDGQLDLARGGFKLDAPTIEPGSRLVLNGGTLMTHAGQSLGGLTLASGAIDGDAKVYSTGTQRLLGSLRFGGGVTFVNTGSFVMSSAGITHDARPHSNTFKNLGTLTARVSSDTFVSVALDSAGTIDAAVGTLDLAFGGVLGGVIEGHGTLALRAGTFRFDNATVTLAAPIVLNGGRLALATGQTLGSFVLAAGAVVGAGTVDIASAVGAVAPVGLGKGVTLVNTGTTEVIGAIVSHHATILNGAGAILDLRASVSGQGVLDNAGTIIGGRQTISIGDMLNTTGTVQMNGGRLVLVGGGHLGGAFTGGGTIVFRGGRVALHGATFAAGTKYVLDGAMMSVTAANRLGGIVIASGELDGSGTISRAGDRFGALTLGGGAEFVNTGTLRTGGLVLGDSAGGATLVNQRGATVIANAGAIGDGGNGAIDNEGRFANAANVATVSVGAATTNNGTIQVTGGAMVFAQAITGAGTLQIAAGATLETNGVAATQTAVFAGAGATLRLDVARGIDLPAMGLGAGDTIALSGVTAATATIDGNTLMVTVAGGATLRFLASASLAADMASVTADARGTLVTLAAAPATELTFAPSLGSGVAPPATAPLGAAGGLLGVETSHSAATLAFAASH